MKLIYFYFFFHLSSEKKHFLDLIHITTSVLFFTLVTLIRFGKNELYVHRLHLATHAEIVHIERNQKHAHTVLTGRKDERGEPRANSGSVCSFGRGGKKGMIEGGKKGMRDMVGGKKTQTVGMFNGYLISQESDPPNASLQDRRESTF